MPIATTGAIKDPAGTTTLGHITSYMAAGSLAAVTAETSLAVIHGPFKEGVLLSDVSAISGAGATLTIRIYNLDKLGTRIGAALVSQAITTVTTTRTVVTAPFGNILEVTIELAGTTPTVTADNIELQLKT